MTTHDDDTVRVELSKRALSRPEFIVQSEGVYYLTLAVWAFDPRATGLTETQKASTQEVQALYEQLVRTPSQRSAVELDAPTVLSAQHTAP